MSKTVTGYIEIPGVSYSEMVNESKLIQEIFTIKGMNVDVCEGEVKFYDGKSASGIVIKKGGSFNQVVLTEKGLVHDDMINKDFLKSVQTVLKDMFPGFLKIEENIRKLKEKGKVVKKTITDSEILVEVEI